MGINEFIRKHNAKVTAAAAQPSGEEPVDGPAQPESAAPPEREQQPKASRFRRMFEPGATVGDVFFGMDRAQVHARANEQKARQLDREAEKKEKRARKMSKKIGRGNMRAARAATTAEGLRAAADRKRAEAVKPEQTQRSSTPPSSGNDVIDQLERLGRLKHEGILSHEEFQAQKAKLLDN